MDIYHLGDVWDQRQYFGWMKEHQIIPTADGYGSVGAWYVINGSSEADPRKGHVLGLAKLEEAKQLTQEEATEVPFDQKCTWKVKIYEFFEARNITKGEGAKWTGPLKNDYWQLTIRKFIESSEDRKNAFKIICEDNGIPLDDAQLFDISQISSREQLYRRKQEIISKHIAENVVDLYGRFVYNWEQKNYMNDLLSVIEKKKNIILQGAPGTGKTFSTAELSLKILGAKTYPSSTTADGLLEEKIDFLNHESVMKAYDHFLIKKFKGFDIDNPSSFGEVDDNGQIAFVTFHQSMDYEEFIEGIKPVVQDGGKDVFYPIKSGILKSIANKAAKDSTNKYVLIIDEINRGNVSKIFGELITLLENSKRRGAEHPITAILPYSSTEFSLPSNLYIIGTMNTTDRSAGSLDYAIRRRFAFETLVANGGVCDSSESGVLNSQNSTENSRRLFEKVYKFIEENKSDPDMDLEDLMIGHSYFMDKCGQGSDLLQKWRYEILPLLLEYHKDGLLNKTPLEIQQGGGSQSIIKLSEARKDYSWFIESEDVENGEE